MIEKRKSHMTLGGVPVGHGHPVRLMGVINASPESFFKKSVPSSDRDLARKAERIEKEGADFIDVGAMSTAPYLKTQISEKEEARRIKSAVSLIRKACSLPISIDTSRRGPAEAGLEAGATILNDVTGLSKDPSLKSILKKTSGLILMAHPSSSRRRRWKDPVTAVRALLSISLGRARKAKVPSRQIVLDPGIGFFRDVGPVWWKWDLEVLRRLHEFQSLGFPLLIGLSRKSFIGFLSGGLPPEKRLPGSLALTAAAVLNGAAIIRTHDVAATRETIKITESLRYIKSF